MIKTPAELLQVFQNKSDCYADTTDESVVMAMSGERFVEVVTQLLQEQDLPRTQDIERRRWGFLRGTT
jgi:hypothetical protein